MSFSTFEPYYEQYKHKIFSYLYYRSGRNKGLAEDLTSEVFMKALEKFHTYKSDQPFQSWIYAIAHHHLIDHFRKNKSKQTVDLQDVDYVLSTEGDVKSSLTRRIASEEVEELLKHLSDEEQTILLMRYFQELPLKDIAEIMDRPEATVRVMVHRALHKLKNKYATLYPQVSLFPLIALIYVIS